jgi:DNA repair exonuclease SbcCD nuclease subunit
VKLLICSDLQLGSGARYGTPARTRLEDQDVGLDFITELVADEGIDALIVAGDVFQHRRPAIDELIVFDRFLRSVPCETILVAGNHDVRGPYPMPTTLDLFKGAAGSVHAWPEVRFLSSKVALAFLPWAHPGPLRSLNRSRTGEKPVPDRTQAAALAEIAGGLRVKIERESSEATPVLVTHFGLSGMRLPTGLSTGELIGETVLDTHDLLAQGWRFIFAGHVHSTDVVTAADGRQAISVGSPWVHDFGEAEGGHGVWVYDSDLDSVAHVAIPGRPFVTLELEPGPGSAGLVQRGGGDAYGYDGDIVRVLIRATEQEAAQLDVEAVKRMLYERGAHKVFVHLEVERGTRARAEVAEDTEPLKAVEAWLVATGGLPDAGERLRDLTDHLLQEA